MLAQCKADMPHIAMADGEPKLTIHISFNYGFFRNGNTDLDQRWILSAEPGAPKDLSTFTVLPYTSQTQRDPPSASHYAAEQNFPSQVFARSGMQGNRIHPSFRATS
jgi:hypothetical protein